MWSSGTAVRISGVAEGRPMVFVHGFGCDQAMWRFVAPDFEVDHRVVLLDLVGAGRSDLSAYDPEKYNSLQGYASDIVEVCRELELRGRRPRGALGQRDDRRPRLPAGAGAVRRAGDGRAQPPLRRRRRLRRRLQPHRHRRAAGRARRQPPRLVDPDGAGDHGQPRASGAGRGAHQQLLPHRSRDRRAVRPRHVPVGQPRRPAHRAVPTLVLQCSEDAIAPDVVGRFVAEQVPGSVFHPARGDGPRSPPECPGGDDGRDPRLPLRDERRCGRKGSGRQPRQ